MDIGKDTDLKGMIIIVFIPGRDDFDWLKLKSDNVLFEKPMAKVLPD